MTTVHRQVHRGGGGERLAHEYRNGIQVLRELKTRVDSSTPLTKSKEVLKREIDRELARLEDYGKNDAKITKPARELDAWSKSIGGADPTVFLHTSGGNKIVSFTPAEAAKAETYTHSHGRITTEACDNDWGKRSTARTTQ